MPEPRRADHITEEHRPRLRMVFRRSMVALYLPLLIALVFAVRHFVATW